MPMADTPAGEDRLSNGSIEKNLQIDLEQMESLSAMAEEKNAAKAGKLTVCQASLALVATNVGGGILGLPYAFYHLGIVLGVIMVFILGVLNHFSTMMYLKTKDLSPRKYESVYELAYLLFGRPSIFVVTTVMFCSNLGALILYYMIIGETLSTLVAQMLLDPKQGQTLEQAMDDIEDYPWYV